MRIRVPADVDMADRIFAGLTARQLAILGAHGLACSRCMRYWGSGCRSRFAGGRFRSVLGLWATTSLEGATWEQRLRRSQALRQASTPGARS